MSSIAKSFSERNRVEVIRAFKDLLPGAFVDLQLNAETPTRIKGKFVGHDEGNYLIVTTSSQNLIDYNQYLNEAQGIIVRTIAEGNAGKCIAFRTTILVRPARPKGLLFLSYPNQIESINLRKETRISTMLPVSIMHRDDANSDAKLDGKTEINGKIIDISAGGCRILVSWPKGQKKIQEVPVYLKVQTGGELKFVVLKAEIKSQNREDPESVSLGLMFIQDNSLNQLLHFLKV